MSKRVYLAGPGVFLPDAEDHGRQLKAWCAEHGLVGLYPADGTVSTAEGIFEANMTLLRSADAVIADISPFRGVHCDPGTAMEIGVAVTLGKPVFGYTADLSPLLARFQTNVAGSHPRDGAGYLIENWDLADNLMVAVPLRTLRRSALEAIADAAAALSP